MVGSRMSQGKGKGNAGRRYQRRVLTDVRVVHGPCGLVVERRLACGHLLCATACPQDVEWEVWVERLRSHIGTRYCCAVCGGERDERKQHTEALMYPSEPLYP
ncbi:hypothetical protein KDH_27430 [Dictyobacter sp. S3.2.2.5]|uniref:Uncharacterized protein n=1 Tax=Dictyobacter halimunensis TaxID=3026934 RepID=A0ABQ6FNQ0_9CHLR|nr:hypothetical protein KDH_27430 [Dictyobacter sp. S3.2.2.5]